MAPGRGHRAQVCPCTLTRALPLPLLPWHHRPAAPTRSHGAGPASAEAQGPGAMGAARMGPDPAFPGHRQ